MTTDTWYKRMFGSGPTGLSATIVLWLAARALEGPLGIPPMTVHPLVRWTLLVLFALDGTVTAGWSLLTLPVSARGKNVTTSGPFRYVRHPLYSALIWGGTGTLALALGSWGVLFSVVPVVLFWTWHIEKEERYMLEKFGEPYRKYLEETGQFFPRFARRKEE